MEPSRIRVVVQQPALPAYRVPVFAALAAREGIDLRLLYGVVPGLPNAEPDGFVAKEVPMRRLTLPGGRDLIWCGAQIDAASRDVADALVLSWNLNVASLVPALLRARHRGVATLLWGHGYAKQDARWRSLPRRRAADLATGVILYGHAVAQRLVDGGFDAERVHVAVNAIDQGPIERARDAWLADPQRLAAFRREHGLGDGPLVLFVSRLTPGVRVDLLVRAAAMLAGAHPALQVAVIGSGDAAIRSVEALASSLGITDRVRCLGPIYGEDRLAPWFLCADLFCYPACVGLSVLHAFGYGLPIVTGDDLASHNPEIESVRDGENGLLFTHGDAEALAAAIDRGLRDRGLRDRLAAEARRTVAERFSLAGMVDGLEGAVRWAVERCRA